MFKVQVSVSRLCIELMSLIKKDQSMINLPRLPRETVGFKMAGNGRKGQKKRKGCRVIVNNFGRVKTIYASQAMTHKFRLRLIPYKGKNHPNVKQT